MARPKRGEQIVHKMEALALTMLERVDKPESNIDMQLDVFDKVGRWVAVRNKVEDQGETQIDDFKRRITGESSSDKSGKPSARDRTPNGGPRLDALKSRIPARTNGSPDGDLDAAGGEVPAASG